VDGKITEKDFANSLLAFAGFRDARGKKMTKRIKKAFSDEEESKVISLFILHCVAIDVVFLASLYLDY
jgi:hypothetical protein